jgi:hypothetical protein
MSLLGVEWRFADDSDAENARNGTVGVVRRDASNDKNGRRCGRTNLDGLSGEVQAGITGNPKGHV